MGKDVALPMLKDVILYAKHINLKSNYELEGDWLITNALRELYPDKAELIRNIFETKEGISRTDEED